MANCIPLLQLITYCAIMATGNAVNIIKTTGVLPRGSNVSQHLLTGIAIQRPVLYIYQRAGALIYVPKLLLHQCCKFTFQLFTPKVFGDDPPVFIPQEAIRDSGYGI